MTPNRVAGMVARPGAGPASPGRPLLSTALTTASPFSQPESNAPTTPPSPTPGGRP
jgi:hypothetical protein